MINKYIYKLEVHFRFGNEQKDFDFHNIESYSLEEAVMKAKKLYRFTFAIYYNGVKQKLVN